MVSSKWIDWEIECCLKEISRKGRTSKTNGLVRVLQEVNGGYDWLVEASARDDGCSARTINNAKLYPIIEKDRFNYRGKSFACPKSRTYDRLLASYSSIIDENECLNDPHYFIDNAFKKSEIWKDCDPTKQRREGDIFIPMQLHDSISCDGFNNYRVRIRLESCNSLI